MSSHINVALEALGAMETVIHCASSLSSLLYSEPITSPTVKSSVPLESSSSLELLWSEAISSSNNLCSISSSNKHFLLDVITATACSFERNNTPNQPWRNKQSVDIWGWCHTPFQSYRPQLCDDSDNIRFIFHFLVPDMHKGGCEIRDCKKKTQTSRGEKKMKQ